MGMLTSITVLIIALGLTMVPQRLLALEEKLVVVTALRKDQSDVFKSGFEKKFSGVQVEILNKPMPAGIKYIQETADNNTTDLFWESVPDAFEVLKGDGLLQKYTPKEPAIPKKIGAYPVNDPDGYYTGFAAAGFGIMYNVEYLEARGLPRPKEWKDLRKAAYRGHVAMSAPSRSGTTHFTVETVLQAEGWDKGWSMWKEIGGNLQLVTDRSFGVPDGINSGDYGVGVVIDFFGLSSRASGFPVDFVYPKITALVPVNIALVKNAPHPQAAKAFIEYLLSPEGQRTLLRRDILRLPVNPRSYVDAPSDFPNPFRQPIGAAVRFDVNLSKRRYNVVNSLFDVMITDQLGALKDATDSIQEAETALAKRSNAEAANLVEDARKLVAAVPITAEEASAPDFPVIFTKKTDMTSKRVLEFEQKWHAFAKKNYAAAKVKAQKSLALLQ